MKIYYGIQDNYTDITQLVFEKCFDGKSIIIPKNDVSRSQLFGDPLRKVLKHININNTIYNDKKLIKILLTQKNINENIQYINKSKYPELYVNYIHSTFRFKHGNFNDELTEQIMSAKFIDHADIVLEIGGNHGRNSLIISSLLKDSKNLVVLETLTNCCQILKKHRRINKLNFHIENSALSKQKLLQRGWHCFPYDSVSNPEKYRNVNIMSYKDLINKYKLNFNVLVLDCEGAFYYILQDFPEIINNINKILIENDFNNNEHKEFVHNLLIKNNFKIVYSQDFNVGKKHFQDFHQTWIR